MAKDFYQVLGLKRDADEKAIKGAYRKLAREHHPDVNPNNPGAEAKFKEISEAFQVLSDSEKRKLYDQFGADYDKIPPEYAKYGPQGPPRSQGAGGGFPGQQSGANFGGNFGGGAGGVNFEELLRQAQTSQGGARGASSGGGVGGGVGGDLFGNLFGGLRGGGRRGPEPGGDVEQAVQISFAESIKGTQRRLNLVIRGERGEEARDVTVKIPALISDGATVKVSGKGASSSSGGPNGDLFLKISVRPDAFWKRDGLNLKIEVPISFGEAALGGQIQVPTAGGEVGLKIPAGTQSGATFRLTGRGLKDSKVEKAGDVLVSVKVVVPKELSARERELVEELAAGRNEDLRGGLPKSL